MRLALFSMGIAGTIAFVLAASPGLSQNTDVKRGEIVIADFEGPSYGEGWITSGDAFGKGPAQGALPGQMDVSGYAGKGLVNSFHNGDPTKGTLTSPEFKIERERINFLAGGGRHPERTGLRLIVGDQTVRRMTGHDSEHLIWRSWDVAGLQGQTAKIEIFDQEAGGWGHINVDQITQSDAAPAVADSRQDALARAEASVKVKAAEIAADDQRPIYHVMPPAYWNNDPNGPIHYKGYYHLFYQSNPYGDDWGNMHWGHVRSKDLAHWERLPIALWPSKEMGEDHVFSGCATIDAKGQVMLIYTSIGPRLPEQWAAIPEDDELIRWKKHPANPIMTEELHKSVKVYEWRDPYVFKAGGKTCAVLGGNLNESKGGQGVVLAYEAANEDLTRWTYRGVLFRHPDQEVKNIECPLFFPIDDKGRWLLITSQGHPVQGFIGWLEEKEPRFKSESRLTMDYGSYYAPNVTIDEKGHRLLWGWVRDFPKGRGWNGCLTLPRLLTLGPDGKLRQQPVKALEALRGEPLPALSDRAMPDGVAQVAEGIRGDALELAVEIDPGRAQRVGVTVRRSSDGQRGIPIVYDGETLKVGERSLPFKLTKDDPTLRLRIFLDRSVTEVYANDRECVTVAAITPPESNGVSLAAKGGDAVLKSLRAWPMKTIWGK